MHYRGLLRVARREGGIRVYAARERPRPTAQDGRPDRERIDALVDVIVAKYAPLPAPDSVILVSRLRYAVPQWQRGCPPRCRGPKVGSHTPASTASTGTGRPGRASRRGRWLTRCGCWRRSIPSCGTGVDSSCSGAGRIGSRHTLRSRSGSSDITRCRCCGGTGLSDGATSRFRTARCRSSFGYSSGGRAPRCRVPQGPGRGARTDAPPSWARGLTDRSGVTGIRGFFGREPGAPGMFQ